MKSRKYYRYAFVVGLVLCPFAVFMDRELMRQWWFTLPFVVVMFTMFALAFKAIHLEERGE